MKDYYLLVGLNSKEIKILSVNQNIDGLIEVTIESKKNKVRCPICNKFTSSVHDKLKPIRSVYLDSCGSKVDLIICKKRYHCYHCNKIFTEELNLSVDKGNISNKLFYYILEAILSFLQLLYMELNMPLFIQKNVSVKVLASFIDSKIVIKYPYKDFKF